jgi:diguanylate cyclase (GGDEF)-like protein/PAS domain S-box-containing protein
VRLASAVVRRKVAGLGSDIHVFVPELRTASLAAAWNLPAGALSWFSRSRRISALWLAPAAAAAVWLGLELSDNSRLGLLPLLVLPHLLLGGLAAHGRIVAAWAAALVLGIGITLAAGAGAAAVGGVDTHLPAALLCAYLITLAAVPAWVSLAHGREAAALAHWRAALDACGTGSAELDLASGRLDMSPAWMDELGIGNLRGNRPGVAMARDLWDRVHPDDMAAVQQALDPVRSASATGRVSCRLRYRDGRWRRIALCAAVAHRDDTGAPRSILFLARDDAERHAAQDELQLADHLFRHLNEGVLVTDAHGRVLKANAAYGRITGSEPLALIGTVPAMLRPAPAGSAQADQQARVYESLRAGGSWRGEMAARRSDGASCTLQATISVLKDGEGLVRRQVLALSDVTQARQQIARLQRQAHFDALTGLPNRVRLTQLLLDALAASERDGSLLTVCYLDLDHFKPVNDAHGHHSGDELLLKLADRLRRSLRTSATGDDVVARMGGDEFVLLMHVASVDESRLAVERVLHVVSLPFGLPGSDEPVVVTGSIGATVFPLDNADAETLLRHADHAMFGAKQAGRSGYRFFDAEHDRRAEARFVEQGRVQEALEAGELCLHYQPKVDMREGRVLGVEALLRWSHPEQGLLMPAGFLPLIEHTALSTSIGDWVLCKGVEQLARWLDAGLDLTLSINVSSHHLQEPLFAANLAELLSRQPTPVAHHLVLEVLETTALADIDFTCALMEQCRALGVRFALDDFGTGYSTLTYLKRLPLDMLKIDRSFVINMLNDRQDMAIVEGVIGLSQTFGCTVVAEGVETLEQAQALIEIGCDIGQGNGIARAMPADAVAPWVLGYGGMTTMVAPLLH